ncbi:hypothetical protein [Acidovorax sp.]|uniref:hypothetical protein n=1 Tax=Acidovorax sp. TaxID=1872122 RepID=UPI002ACDD0E3|nr:hypothetical protein [Acidovorax sp.]MDZ7863041.1 hypothetical protein [Acidovorax sp.]
MKADFPSLDASMQQVLAARPSRLDDILQVRAVRDHTQRAAPRRSVASPGSSADTTIHERMQALRRAGRVGHEPPTGRWEVSPQASQAVPPQPLASTGFALQADLQLAPPAHRPLKDPTV